jgi:acyl-CoA synthetase (AMP-forming)/AMP-acid ligase II
VKAGDTVAAFIPNNEVAVVAQLAASALGAVFSSCPGEFGAPAVLERFTQIKPKLLVTADAYRYNGKDISLYDKAGQIASALKPLGLKRVLVMGQLERSRKPRDLPKTIGGVEAAAWHASLEGQSTSVKFWRGPAMAPLWVLYSSGTTGKPKAIVHHGKLALFELRTGPTSFAAGGMLLSAISTVRAICSALAGNWGSSPHSISTVPSCGRATSSCNSVRPGARAPLTETDRTPATTGWMCAFHYLPHTRGPLISRAGCGTTW